MINFNEQEKEIIKNELEDTLNAMNLAIKEDFNDLASDDDFSVYYSLSMAYYLLKNIDNLYSDKSYQLILQKYFIKDIWNAVDEEVQNKVYSLEENKLYNKIINYKW